MFFVYWDMFQSSTSLQSVYSKYSVNMIKERKTKFSRKRIFLSTNKI